MFDALRVLPGAPAAIAQRDPGDRLGFTDKASRRAAPPRAPRQAAAVAEPAVGRAAAQPAAGAAGHGCVGQGRYHSHRALRREPAGHAGSRRSRRPPGARPRTTTCGGCTRCVPMHGEIGIFNRSHYEDVLAVRVRSLAPERVWRPRFRHIREFERMLADEGTTVVKVFLHISPDEQRRRLQARIDDPEKRWKFRQGRPRRPRAVGAVPRGLRGGDHRDLDEVVAVVRGAVRPQVGAHRRGRQSCSSTRSRRWIRSSRRPNPGSRRSS